MKRIYLQNILRIDKHSPTCQRHYIFKQLLRSHYYTNI